MRAAYGESDGKWREPYSTEDELQFIAHIGHGKWTKRPQMSVFDQRRKRALRLEGYIAGAELRTDWGDVDKAECIAYARKMLKYTKSKGLSRADR